MLKTNSHHSMLIQIQLQEDNPFGQELRKMQTGILVEKVVRNMMQKRVING